MIDRTSFSHNLIAWIIIICTAIFPFLLQAQRTDTSNTVRFVPKSSPSLRFSAKIDKAQYLDVSTATYDKNEEKIALALGVDLTLAVWQSIQFKHYPAGMDDYKWRYKYAEAMSGYNNDIGYTCTRMCLLENGFTSLIKIEAATNQGVKKAIRPKKDFYAFIPSEYLTVQRDYSKAEIPFGARARILGTGIGEALDNPFRSEYMKEQLYKTLFFLDTPNIQRIIERSTPAAMPPAIATAYNYEFTKYKGDIYNGYAMGVIYGKVLMCIPARENYHIASLCLRPYEDIYLLLQAGEVEVDDGTGSIGLLTSEYPFNCNQLVNTTTPKSHGKPMHAVTKVLKNQTTECTICLGKGKVFYADGYKKEYVNMTYQKVSQQFSSKRCTYCRGTGQLRIPDVTVEVYVED